MPARYGHEGYTLRVVTDLLNEVGCFLHDFVESVFTPLQIDNGVIIEHSR